MSLPTRKNHPLLSILKSSLFDLPSPSNLSVWWKFGSLLGFCLIIQILTGLFISMHFSADISLAFSSLSHICRDVKFGWLLRKMHANTASLFFVCLYCHMGRGIYYGSYLNHSTWNVGVILFLVTMITAFVGYVLPWGQMSFWAATVMTNLLSAIPYMGKSLVLWMWGGFSVDKATLNRFFTFHFLLPFVMLALSVMHLLFLHQTGSKNPTGINSNMDKSPFHPYFTSKDTTGFLFLTLMALGLSLLMPTTLSDPENFIPANPLVTPPHMQPEWYFLFAYAILRSIPNKLGGVIALISSILVWLLMPLLHTSKKQASIYRPLAQVLFWSLIANFMMLTWIGSQPVEQPYMVMGQISSLLYFAMFTIAQPISGLMEKQ